MINYEIHLTVSLSPFHPESISVFKDVCGQIGVKPIVIAAEPLTDVMTSFRMQSDDQNEVFRIMTRHAMLLAGKGYHVVRSKVETDLTHPAARTPLPNQYFESHVQVRVDPEELKVLRELQQGLDFHLSYNAFKTLEGAKQVRMATIREYHTTPDKFTTRIQAFRSVLEAEGLELHKGIELEFALYDSNAKHDQPWIDETYASRRV